MREEIMISKNSLGFILCKTQRKLQNAYNHKLKQFDITVEQWGILNCLSETGGIVPTELSEIILKDKPNTIRILNKLKKKELVIYQDNPSDKRSYLILITEKGRYLLALILPLVISVRRQAVKGISEEKKEELVGLLDQIYYNL
ncbi:MAG TPA: MarR family transcriptional regulator [Negativicutes bacterium]